MRFNENTVLKYIIVHMRVVKLSEYLPKVQLK